MSRRATAIAIAAAAAITLIWYVTLWSPQSKSIKTANARTVAAQATQAGLRTDISVLKEEQAQLPSKQAELAKLKQALPDMPSLDILIDNINAAAIGSGVDWQTISPTKPAGYSGGQGNSAAAAQSMPVTMSANGLYAQLLDFVNRLNAMPRLLTVGSINISGVGGPAKTTAQITTQVFYVPSGSKPVTTSTTLGH